MLDYLEKLRAKPHHIRRRVAVGTAAGITALVAGGWVVVFSTSGVLNLSVPALDQSDAASLNNAVAQTKSSFSNLVGAAAVAQSAESSGTSGMSAQTGITVITDSSTTAPTAPTTIPF